MKRLTTLAALLLLSGCAVGPDYVEPALPDTTAGTFAEAGSPAAAALPLPDAWWKLYEDPALDRLVSDALAHNTDLRSAAANLEQARAVLSQARSRRLPTTDVSASAQRLRSNAAAMGVGGAPGGSFETDLYQLGFDAGYEIDLFGGVTRAVQAARADTEAARAQLDAARVSVAGETVRTYLAACSGAAQYAVLRDTVKLQQDTVSLTRRLFEAGRGTRRDLDRAGAQLAQTEAQLPGVEAERRAALYALATLTGSPPSEIDPVAAVCLAPPVLRQPIPVGDGAALLNRRPDVRAAERTLAADTARIGVAVADLYPKINLLGSIGFGGTEISDIGDSDNLTFSVGPFLSWSFPNQAAARARVRQAEAVADGSLAAFDGTVLTALREVEQALARYDAEMRRNRSLRQAEAASANALDLSRKRFDYGADSFLQLIDAQSELAAVRASRAGSDAALAEAQVSLFKALGGGWQDAPEPVRKGPKSSAAGE